MESYVRSLAKFLVESERTEAIVTLSVALTLSAVIFGAYALTGDHSFAGLSLVLAGLGTYSFGYKNLKTAYQEERAGMKSPRYSWCLLVCIVGVAVAYTGVSLLSHLGTDHLLTTFTKLATRRLF